MEPDAVFRASFRYALLNTEPEMMLNRELRSYESVACFRPKFSAEIHQGENVFRSRSGEMVQSLVERK
ncbi:hypothetical protein AKJ40_02660 [candidate division MSBL1 archaeon SCGC-AAA259M10]|uniref:Uncharacterized protein n=1 Tax=candidate division MSBL1 archaeon SCGC-AAA259M10 TaxID=1698270 RepID=A0A133UZQ6_9EURY|nr:hypothetical protein AKJ40_02660 [candidate division MSBL1 archaeon SCGC-AAA259M10]